MRHTNTQRNSDPDRTVARKLARKVGIKVAILSAVMVLAGVLLLLGYFFAADHGRRDRDTRPDRGDRGFSVRLDPESFLEMVPLVGLSVIVLAGGGAMLFARQAAKPLEESMRRQRNFIGDASHELRTPLAVIDARIQQAQIIAGDEPRLQQVLADLRSDSRVMTGIVNELLASVSAPEVGFDPAPLRSIAREVARDLSVVAEGRGVSLAVVEAAGAELWVNVPEIQLRRSIAALADNALGHTAAGGAVRLEIAAAGRWATLRVIDEGRGITGIAPDQVFERFARGEQANIATEASESGAPRQQSHGIGLALVHDVVTRHGGSVGVERTGATGTVFLVRLPIVRGGGDR